MRDIITTIALLMLITITGCTEFVVEPEPVEVETPIVFEACVIETDLDASGDVDRIRYQTVVDGRVVQREDDFDNDGLIDRISVMEIDELGRLETWTFYTVGDPKPTEISHYYYDCAE